jgi:hypothetical protein
MRQKVILIGIIISCLALTSNCAVVTSYGKKPLQDPSDKDIYSFKVYPNHFANVNDINKYAIGEIHKFMAEQGYVSYKILERYRDTADLSPVVSIIYKVKFDRSPDNIPVQRRN